MGGNGFPLQKNPYDAFQKILYALQSFGEAGVAKCRMQSQFAYDVFMHVHGRCTEALFFDQHY